MIEIGMRATVMPRIWRMLIECDIHCTGTLSREYRMRCKEGARRIVVKYHETKLGDCEERDNLGKWQGSGDGRGQPLMAC
jgi:hypothetical protein